MDSKRTCNYPALVLKTKKALFQRPIVVVRRPDEISTTEISLGRQRRKERKGKNLMPSGKSNGKQFQLAWLSITTL
jgi:hypothetical protein